MKKLFLILIFILTIFLISSCRLLLSIKNTSVYEQFEIYSYKSNGNDNIPGTIYDLVDEARDEPIIVFPHSRNEMNNIGLVLNKGFLGKFRYSINFGKQQKIYFHSYNIINTDLYFNSNIYLKLFAPNFNYSNFKLTQNKFLNKKGNEKNIIFLNYEEYQKAIKIDNNYNILPANVSYYIGDDKPFFIDDIDGDTVVTPPPVPFKEGYEFKGWFYDLNFKDEIDFNYDKIPNKVYNEKGNYQYIENKFYAKWVNSETKKIYKYDIYK